jgi:hypothetical protein
MQKYLCKLGLHKYVSLNMTDCFITGYIDRDWTIKHVVWYQQCYCCGKRRLKESYKRETLSISAHAGIEYARLGWETYGRMYLGGGKETTLKPIEPKLKVIEGGKSEQ